MRGWMREDWAFEITVTDGKAEHCRIGLETGDRFSFEYGCPAGFCPRAMIEIFTWCEVIRCGGDFTARVSKDKYVMDFPCPCNCVQLRLEAKPMNRDESGAYRPHD